MKNCSESLAVRENANQNHNDVPPYLRMAITQKLKKKDAGKDVKERSPDPLLVGM